MSCAWDELGSTVLLYDCSTWVHQCWDLVNQLRSKDLEPANKGCLDILSAMGVQYNPLQVEAKASLQETFDIEGALAAVEEALARHGYGAVACDDAAPVEAADLALAEALAPLLASVISVRDHKLVCAWFGACQADPRCPSGVRSVKPLGRVRVGGQVDMRPVPRVAAAAADAAIAKNKGQEKKASQRQKEKAAKAGDGKGSTSRSAGATADAADGGAAAQAKGSDSAEAGKAKAVLRAAGDDPVVRCEAGLAAAGLCPQRISHEAVVATPEVRTSNEHHHDVLLPKIEGGAAGAHIVVSLLLKGKKKKELVMVVKAPGTKVDTKKLGAALKAKHGLLDKEFRLADATTMEKAIGVGKDFVSPLCLSSDLDGAVKTVVFDATLATGTLWCLPPRVNTESWGLGLDECRLFCDKGCGVESLVLDLQ